MSRMIVFGGVDGSGTKLDDVLTPLGFAVWGFGFGLLLGHL